MRKVLLAMALLVGLVLPMTARAQNEVVLQNVSVQLWPEYDQASVLAIVEFTLPPETSFPVKVTLRYPANATLTAVAKNENTLVEIPSEKAEVSAEWSSVAFSVDGPEAFRIEYYYPYAKAGATRSFSYIWPGDYAVKALLIEFQEPTGMKNLSSNPVMSDPFPKTNTLIYHDLAVSDLPAGTPYQVDIQYDRTTDEMTASGLSVEPSGGSITPSEQNLALTTVLPYALGALGLLLIVGGGVWYWQSGLSSSDNSRKRNRHASRSKEEDNDDDDHAATYCHQCGKRAGPSDKFCRACGTRLRLEE